MMPTRMVMRRPLSLGGCAAGRSRPTLRPQRREVLAGPGARSAAARPGRTGTCPARRCRTAPGRGAPSAASTAGMSGLAERRLDHDAEADGRREARAAPRCARARIAGSTCLRWTYRIRVRVVADELEVVGAAVRDVPGVEAQVDGLGVRARRGSARSPPACRRGCPRGCGTRAPAPCSSATYLPELGHARGQAVPLVVGQGRAGDRGCRRGPCSPRAGSRGGARRAGRCVAISASQSRFACSSASVPLWSATTTVPPVSVEAAPRDSSRTTPGSVGR